MFCSTFMVKIFCFLPFWTVPRKCYIVARTIYTSWWGSTIMASATITSANCLGPTTEYKCFKLLRPPAAVSHHHFSLIMRRPFSVSMSICWRYMYDGFRPRPPWPSPHPALPAANQPVFGRMTYLPSWLVMINVFCHIVFGYNGLRRMIITTYDIVYIL